jgi:hypothetical protein
MSQIRWKVSHEILAKRELARVRKILEKKFAMPVTLPTTPDNLLDWTMHVRRIQGRNFSFEGRDYLKQIYSDSNKRIMIAKPRQMEITEFALNWLSSTWTRITTLLAFTSQTGKATSQYFQN